MTQATRKKLKPADSRQTCHSAALRPQHGFNQLDLVGGERGGGLEEINVESDRGVQCGGCDRQRSRSRQENM